MTILYYWFTDAPEDRPGGPWWAEVGSYDKVKEYFDKLYPFLHAWAWWDGRTIHGIGGCIAPPKTAKIYFKENLSNG